MRTFRFRDEVENSPPPPIRSLPQHHRPTRRGPSWWSKIFAKVRATIVFLLLATIATLVMVHFNQIKTIAAAKARMAENTLQKERTQDSLRQAALNYEKQVESVGSSQNPAHRPPP